ncbi:MAG: hypothetical protein J6U64_00100 [Alphaproteobacteria bacterium]|nr:hypothetical protein [Alphaproteobacteria bacterium]
MFEEKITYLNRLQKLSHSDSYSVETYQNMLVDSFFSGLVLDIDYAESKEEKENLQQEIEAHSDLATLSYYRGTLWEKITRSKKNPIFEYKKDKKEIFEELLNRHERVRKRFSGFLDSAIKNEQDMIALQKEMERRNKYYLEKTPTYGQTFDKDGDYIPDRLALVHTTRYMPKKDENGQYMLESLATATKLAHPRNTLHFSIGHHVESHLDGAWDDTPYVIIAPMKETMDECGKPMGISSVDTFFEVGLNENMHLPEKTHLIEPSDKKMPEGIFSITHGNRTIYKQTGFTQKEKLLLGIDKPMSDKEIATIVKKRTTKEMIGRLGYVKADFENSDSLTAQKIENMGKKLGVRSSAGSALHSCIALSGINRLGKGINTVYALINDAEKPDTSPKEDVLMSLSQMYGESYLRSGKDVPERQS